MRILIAPDKFKGSLGAAEVAAQIAAGLREVLPSAEIVQLPVADGGEGTAAVICAAAGGEWHTCTVQDPLGRVVSARYAMIEDGATAVMEMSAASGLWRLAADERDPLQASSFGTGEMLLDAARRGVREIIIGLGGSATNDGGLGMARALGFRFLGTNGAATANLAEVERVIAPDDLRLPAITAAVDVRNPLLGPRGATRVFGPQKGATPDQVETLEAAMTHIASLVGGDPNMAGAGAAGGLGFGLVRFCGAALRSGFEVVAERIGLEVAIRASDFVITGEGRLDAQTLEGKAPAGVAALARAAGKRVFAIVGEAEDGSETARLFDAVMEVACGPVTRGMAIANARQLLQVRGAEIARLLRC